MPSLARSTSEGLAQPCAAVLRWLAFGLALRVRDDYGCFSFLGPLWAEKRASSPSPGGQSHFRGLRRENRDSPRERLRNLMKRKRSHGVGASCTKTLPVV